MIPSFSMPCANSEQYSWLETIPHMGILVRKYSTNFLLQKLPVAKYLAAKWDSPILWLEKRKPIEYPVCSAGGWSLPVPQLRRTGALMAVRFLLGIFNSCVRPTFIILYVLWTTYAYIDSDETLAQLCGILAENKQFSPVYGIAWLESNSW